MALSACHALSCYSVPVKQFHHRHIPCEHDACACFIPVSRKKGWFFLPCEKVSTHLVSQGGGHPESTPWLALGSHDGTKFFDRLHLLHSRCEFGSVNLHSPGQRQRQGPGETLTITTRVSVGDSEQPTQECKFCIDGSRKK